MNAMPPPTPLILESAPFSAAQRAWLNGFLAGLYGAAAQGAMSTAPEPEEYSWHDPALELDERLSLAEGRPPAQRMMAAMAQLDCGQCGYLCQTYAAALAEGRESSTSLCVPGAKPTARMLKQIIAEAAVLVAEPAAKAPPAGLPVQVLSAAKLTAAGSAKDVRHVEIDLAGSGLSYVPGDSLSLAAPNDPMLVQACIVALHANGDEAVPCPDGIARPLGEALAAHVDIARPLARTTARPPLADLVRSLPAPRPRLYSIASSLRTAPGQVHLCVSVVREMRRARLRLGVASAFLGERAVDGGTILALVQPSHFRLPADPATPVIMVGPGTGIAPFRAFLQERAALGIRGRCWLFFGDQHEATDFLYQGELRRWLADGTLSRLDTAFSRDQARKLYVQDRMLEQAADLWRWLQDGGHFHVCGDATRMARDVDATLRRIATTQGGLDEAQARDWIVSLARQGRYLRDVY